MNFDAIVTGVGGQGVLSVTALIIAGGADAGLRIKMSEEHGMAQRGGSVVTHLRLSDREICSDLVPLGRARLVLGLEPLEALRQATYLAADGILLTTSEPVVNFPGYPALEETLRAIGRLPGAIVIETARLSRQGGGRPADNMVMLGAAAALLPFPAEFLEHRLREMFDPKGARVVESNLRAFQAGRDATVCARA